MEVIMAIRREVIATWKPSLSPDVLAQKLHWYLNGRLVKRVVVRARENRRAWSSDNNNVLIREGDTVQIRVCAVDEVGESAWIQGEVVYPYTSPEGPSDLKVEKLPIHLDVK